jgi:asparagine synthase (glutamine-hydrolysing)
VANFLAILSKNLAEKETVIERSVSTLSPFPGMIRCRKDVGDCSIVWSVSPCAPVSWCETDRWACLLIGEAIVAEGDRRVGAAEVGAAWTENGAPLEGWDGFHVAVVFDKKRRSLSMGADCVGAFPAYYLDQADSAVVASSPRILAHHPRADLSMDLQGFAGILHTCGLVGERTLCAGIRRLAPRKVWSQDLLGRRSRNDQVGFAWDPETSRRWAAMNYDEQVEILAQASGKVARRHFGAHGRVGQLLSGGLDSRMVAGYARECGLSPNTVTFGAPHEMEALVARMVAKRLGWKNRILHEPYDDYAEVAENIASSEHLSAGFAFSFGPMVSNPGVLSDGGERMLTGLQLDFIASGCCPRSTQRDTYNLGFLPDSMRRFLPGGPMREAYQAMLEEGEEYWRDCPGEEYQKILIRDLEHSGRHHVGINLWRMSFGSWPVTMSLDREYVSVCRALPHAVTCDRRGQKLLVKRRFPDLAALPMDQNSIHWSYLPGVPRNLRVDFLLRASRKWNHLMRREMRYYYNAYCLEAGHWGQIRKLAEPGREAVGSLFDRAEFDRLMAPPGQRFPLEDDDEITGSASRKVLLGAMLLAQRLPLLG